MARTPGSKSKRGFNLTKRLRALGVTENTPLAEVERLNLLHREGRKPTAAPLKVTGSPIESDTLPKNPPNKMTAETDAQVEKRISERFAIMVKMAEATALGKIRSLIISGPPGLGKSYEVFNIVEKYKVAGRVTETIVRGNAGATGIYRTCFENNNPNSIIVFDDADAVWYDDICLNLLKIATDTTASRRLSWLKETRMTTEQGLPIPRSFTFHGAIIFISNLDFEALIARGHRLAPHLEAIMSRTHYLDMGMKTRRDYLIRIKQVLRSGMLRKADISPADEKRIMLFIESNVSNVRELSLRTVVKCADLLKLDPKNWEMTARHTVLK